jgi:hypothetical protein
VKALGCEIIFPNMRRLTHFFFILGLLVITHGLTRWDTFRKFVTPEYGGEGDPRFMAAFQQMFIEVAIGLVLVSIAAYLFNCPKKSESQPVIK